ncbi:hypothetical protein Tco_1431597 [Tanacetum coccineum]
MSQDQSIPRRNKVDWHMANDDPIPTTMRFIPQRKVVQRYGSILPDYLTNLAMKESKVYKTYYDLATGKVQPKPKFIRRSSRTKFDEAPKPSSDKRVKATAKVAKSGKKKQPAHGLETLSDMALTKAEQMKLAIERSKTQLHISQPSSSGTYEGTGVTPRVSDVPTYEYDDEQISWKSSDEEDDDEENFSTHGDEAMQDKEVNEEDSFDPRVQTPSHVESTDDEDSDDENVEEDKMNKEETCAEDEANVLYGDETEDTYVILTAPINPEGQQQSSSVLSGFVSNMLNPRPDTSIDSIFNLNTEATSLIDVPVTTIAEPPLVFATTLPPPPTPLITHMQQTPVPIQTIVPSTSLQDLPNFGSLFGLIDDAQAENEYFLNKLDDNIKKIIKNQVKEQVKAQVSKILAKIKKTVNEQLEAEIMTHSSTKSKTSLALAANLSELELKKILIEKMESNKSIHRSNEQKNLYKALVEAYESDKLILDTYGDIVSFKRRKDNEDKDEEPSARSNRGGQREDELEMNQKEQMHTDKDLEEPAHQEFHIGATKEQSNEETSQHPDWFQRSAKHPTPDRDWNKTLPADHGLLTDTPFDFSAFVMNRLKVETLTPKLLAGPTFKLMKGTCKSLVELEYFFEEVYKETTKQLDWTNLEGQQYPHDLLKPLPLIPNSRGR